MNKDRGDIKWQPAMMLPEYAKLLAQAKEDFYKVEQPILDEQMMQEIQTTIHEAMEYNLLLEFEFYEAGCIESIKGYVHFIDYQNKHYRVKDIEGDLHRFNFEKLTAVNPLEEHIEFE